MQPISYGQCHGNKWLTSPGHQDTITHHNMNLPAHYKIKIRLPARGVLAKIHHCDMTKACTISARSFNQDSWHRSNSDYKEIHTLNRENDRRESNRINLRIFWVTTSYYVIFFFFQRRIAYLHRHMPHKVIPFNFYEI